MTNCCGIQVLSGFGNTNTSLDSTNYTKKEIIDFILESRKTNFLYRNKRIQLITLNEEQLNKITPEVFIELGFEISKPMLYKEHSNNIYILTYSPNDNKP